MRLALRPIKVYGRLGLIWAIAILVLLIVLFNRNNVADVWFFRTYREVNVLYLMLLTAVAAIAVFWAVTRIRGVLREARALREERQAAEQLAEREKLAGELVEREKRLDEKLRRSITEES
ncbi:MAG: hypothetical protein JXA69_03665 [Phycisphaerae bacterium]|nr:hypothetical protein [Phycisphaerae bacterium]